MRNQSYGRLAALILALASFGALAGCAAASLPSALLSIGLLVVALGAAACGGEASTCELGDEVCGPGVVEPPITNPGPEDNDLDDDGYGPTDCDDHQAAINPGASENCSDGIDNDCDGTADDADVDCGIINIAPEDLDLDGYHSLEDCDDHNAAINPGAEDICYDGVDQNCDGDIDEGCPIIGNG